ncbi:MAG: hypothetical protein WDO12_11470 [Pseudomonadota bacterium]
MRPSALPLVALLFAAAARAREEGPVTPPADAPRAVIANCAATAPAKHTGLTQLEQDCPGIEAALTQLRLADALADGVADRIDARSLDELLAATRAASHAGPDPGQLDSVLKDLHAKDAPESRWQRFRRWLERLLMPRAGGSASPWLSQWLQRLTPGKLVSEIILWGLMITVVVAALIVVVRELRASELRWANPLRRARRAGTAAMPGPADETVEWRQLDVPQRPAALFRYVAAQLAAAGRLPPPRGYTHRELRQRARLDLPEQRAAWNELARVAERQIYAPQSLADAEVGRVVAEAARIWAEEPR